MKLIPAIDLKNNKCVRLEQGKEENTTTYNNDPREQAVFFEKCGCERIHIVDLDGAFGRQDINKNTILEIRKSVSIPIQLGGGIKNEDDVSFWVEAGIDFLILGSLSVKNSNLVLKIANKYPNQIYTALDILNQKIMIKGWLEESNLTVKDIFSIYNKSTIKGYVLTDISRDGLLYGLNFDLIKNISILTKKDIIVGGGLSDYSDIRSLKEIFSNTNVEGAIAGKSIYSGSIELVDAMELIK